MCENLERMGCLKQPAAKTCVQACVSIETEGDFTLCPKEVAAAKSCEEADAVAGWCDP